MVFDWLRFLQQNHIHYVERSPNINRNQVGVQCPFCGVADPSEHMAINYQTARWVCRRNNKQHSGNSPVRLVAALLRISIPQAMEIVGDDAPLREPDDVFGQQVRGLMAGPAAKRQEFKPHRFPAEFKPLVNKGMGRMFYSYLLGRGYTEPQLDQFIARFGIRYAATGRYGYRVIVPVWTKQGLMSWTGRSISARAEIRYLSLSAEDWFPDPAPPLIPIKDLLLNQQDLDEGGELLICGEGPFDGARLDLYGYGQGIRGTCMFGKTLSDEQVTTLLQLSPRYKRRVLMLDRDAAMDSFGLWTRLERGGWKMHRLSGGKDPGAMAEKEIRSLFSHLISTF